LPYWGGISGDAKNGTSGPLIRTCSKPVITIISGVGVDDDLVTLTDADEDVVSGIWYNRNEIHGYDLEIVGVYLEPEGHINADVDHTDFVGGACNELRLEVLSAADAVGIGTTDAIVRRSSIDESVVHAWWSTILNFVPQLFGGSVVPVLDHECSQVFVVVSAGWSVDNQWAVQAVSILKSKMRMVPSGSVLRGGEGVSHGLAGSNWALGDTRNSIILGVVQLTHAMEMGRGSVFSHVVSYMDHEGISPVCDQSWAWDCPVVGKDEAGKSVWSHGDIFYSEPVLANDSSDWSHIVPRDSKINRSNEQPCVRTLPVCGEVVLAPAITRGRGVFTRLTLDADVFGRDGGCVSSVSKNGAGCCQEREDSLHNKFYICVTRGLNESGVNKH
jgi:hypothetical protein